MVKTCGWNRYNPWNHAGDLRVSIRKVRMLTSTATRLDCFAAWRDMGARPRISRKHEQNASPTNLGAPRSSHCGTPPTHTRACSTYAYDLATRTKGNASRMETTLSPRDTTDAARTRELRVDSVEQPASQPASQRSARWGESPIGSQGETPRLAAPVSLISKRKRQRLPSAFRERQDHAERSE